MSFLRLLALLTALGLGSALAAEQGSVVTPTAGPMSAGTFTADHLNPALRAVFTNSWGPTAPANGPGSAPAFGQWWLDTSASPSHTLRMYDGSAWTPLATMNASTHQWSINAPSPTGSWTVTVAGNALITRSGSSGNYTALSMGRTAEEAVLGVAGASNQFFTGTIAGDIALKGTNANSLWFGIGGTAAAGFIDPSNQWHIRSGASGSFTSVSIGRTADEGIIGVAGLANQFFTGTAPSDFVIKGLNANKLWFGIGGTTAAGYIDPSNRWVFGSTAASAPDAVLTVSSNVSALPTNPDPSEQWLLRVAAIDNTTSVLGIDSFGGGLSALVLERARGTNASRSAVQTGDLIGAISWHGYYTGGASGYSGGFAQVRAFAAGNFSDTSQPGQISIWTTPTGSTAASVREVARFDQDRSSSFFGNTNFTGSANTFTNAAAAAITARSGAAGSFTSISIGRTAEEGVLGVVGVSDQFFTGTIAGDIALKGTNSNTVWLGVGGLNAAAKFDSSQNTTLLGALRAGGNSTSALPSVTGPIQFAAADGSETVLTVDTFGNSVGSAFIARSSQGTGAAPTASQANDILGLFGAIGRGATAYSLTNAQVRFVANQTFTGSSLSGAQGTRIDFLVTPNGSPGTSIITAGSIENDGGLTWPRTVTGGSKGAGTINATGLYVGGTAVLTGNQTVTLSGDLSGSGATTITATIQSAAVTYAKIQNVAASRLLGNPTGSPAAPSEISLGSTLAFSGTALQTAALTGDVTTPAANSFATTLANIPSGVPVAGTLLHTNIAAPSSPASGKVSAWTDSTDLRFHDKNSAGTIGTTVVADTGAASNYISAISAAGVITKSRPACATLSDAGGYCNISAGQLTNSIGANVAMNNTANYFDGPSVAQGSTGVWFSAGTVTLTDTNGAAQFNCKLWDGTNAAIDAAQVDLSASFKAITMSLSGFSSSPAGNMRISCKDLTSTGGIIAANGSGNGNKDSTITAFRIN